MTRSQNGVAVVVETLGRLDVLVNNAGIEKMQPFLEITSSDWERQVAVNLSSVAGLMGPIDLAPNGAVKAGIVGLTRAAALDLADFGITVNAIAPGPITTDLLTRVWAADALRERAEHAPIPG